MTMVSAPRICVVVAWTMVAAGIPGAPLRAQSLPAAVFETELSVNTSKGHAALRWSCEGDSLEYELQSAESPDFAEPITEYQGADESSFQSGLPDGEYYYRVRARPLGTDDWGPWSESVHVICQHHSLALAWTLFVSGGVLFLCIVLFVCINARNLDRFETSHA